MTGKRFTVKQRQGATIYSIEDYYGELPLNEGIYYKSNADKLCKWLNNKNETIERLKDNCKVLDEVKCEIAEENEQLKQFQNTVFVLINEMIETANHYRTPIKSLDYGDDLGYWNGVYQKLKELREILEKEKGDVE